MNYISFSLFPQSLFEIKSKIIVSAKQKTSNWFLT